MQEIVTGKHKDPRDSWVLLVNAMKTLLNHQPSHFRCNIFTTLGQQLPQLFAQGSSTSQIFIYNFIYIL